MLSVVNKKIEEIKKYQNNPRFNDEAIDYVQKSIKQFGMLVPILLDENNEIICGHTRYEACKRLGYKEIPCLIANELTDNQVKAFRLIDNKSQEIAKWDYVKLEDELLDLMNADVDFKMDYDFNFELPEFLNKEDHILNSSKPVDESDVSDEKMILQITFNNKEDMDSFMDKYRYEIVDEYGCNVTVKRHDNN